MLHINDLTYRIGGRILLEQATAVVPQGHKVGLIGHNGSGKSTLLKLIMGELEPDTGSINLRNNARIGTVSQKMPEGGFIAARFRACRGRRTRRPAGGG